MQHVLNIAFDFDDEKVKQVAEKAVATDMATIINAIVTDKIAPMTSGWYGKQERDWSNMWHKVDSAIDKIIADNRDEIIEKAAEKLVKSVRSTKAWKEKFAEIMDEVQA